MAAYITFRPIEEKDMEFLYQVYASTREEELAQVDWDEAKKETFLRMQFSAQHQHYQKYYAEADYSVILVDDVPAGRLYLDWGKDEIRIIDIALLPEYRGKGTGTLIVKDLQSVARKKGLPVRIHVEQFNPAMKLYNKLGFKKIRDAGVYNLMEWIPEKSSKPDEKTCKKIIIN
jgi:GNAT superfamily N-acetyltransferase